MSKITQEELDSVDPKIKDIFVNINKLPFIEKTHYSCEGHPTGVYDEDICNAPNVTIEYSRNPKYLSIVDEFRHDMRSVPFCDGELERKAGNLNLFYYHYTVHTDSEFQQHSIILPVLENQHPHNFSVA